jgi:ABC-type transport system substrate-binding protein
LQSSGGGSGRADREAAEPITPTGRPRHARQTRLARIARVVGPTVLVAGIVGLLAAGCGSGSSDSSAPADTTQRGAQAGTVPADTKKAVPGGKVIYGLEAESDGFNPTVNRWAISGVMVGLAVYDPLAAFNDKSEAKPYLADSITPNADFTEWTITLRSGITFSNGTPLTADAVKQTLDAHLASKLTAPVFAPVKSVTVKGDLSVVVAMKTPWVVFPTTLTAQTGVIPEPSTLSNQAGDKPIGTGPFTQTEWQKDNKWVGTKNKTYWRKDADGVQLPYLDTVEFHPIPLYNSRLASFDAGDIQMMHSSDPQAIKPLRDEQAAGKIQLFEDNGEGEEGFVIMNNDKAPFDSLDARRALAYATDSQTYTDTIDLGVLDPADGPFRQNSKWHSDFKNYPEYDVAKATELVNKYKSEHNGQAPTFTFGVTQDNTKEGAFLQAEWQQAGFVVDVKTYEQASFITDAVTGNYQANLWRQFGAPDPDADAIWWYSANAGDPNNKGLQLTLNIARHRSTCVDTALDKGRTNSDLAVRKAAYADLQQCFADEVPYVWLDHSVWAVAASLKVHNVLNGPLPDGEASLPIGGAGDFGGVTRMTQVWIEH